MCKYWFEVLVKLAELIQNDKKLNCIWKEKELENCQKCDFCHTEEFIAALKEREESYPTSVGYSFAIPHGKCNTVSESGIAFARLKNEIEWDEELGWFKEKEQDYDRDFYDDYEISY